MELLAKAAPYFIIGGICVKAKSYIFLIFLIFLLIGCSSNRKAETMPKIKQSQEPVVKEVLTEGYGITEEEALSDAQIRALQEGIGFYLSGKELVSNYTLMEKEILTRTKGIILGYEILESKCENNGIYRIKIKAKVSSSLPDDNIWQLIEEMKKPIIRLEVTISGDEKVIDERYVEAAFENNLSTYGFQLTSPEDSEMTIFPNYILKIETTSEYTGELYSLETARSIVSISLVSAYTENVITSLSTETGASDISRELALKKSVRAAISDITKPLIKDVLLHWLESTTNGMLFRVVALDCSYEEYQNLQDILKAMSIVKNVYPREFQNNRCIIDIRSVGSVNSLVFSLENFYNSLSVKTARLDYLEISLRRENK